MPIRNRNEDKPDLPANWQLDYYLTLELSARFNVPLRYREPAGTRNKSAAERLLAQRERSVADGTWTPHATGSKLTVAEVQALFVAQREADGISTWKDERSRLRDHVLPVIGARRMALVSRGDVKTLIAGLVSGGKLAPRTVHRVYEAMQALWQFAMAHEPPLAMHNPCTLTVRAGELPGEKDKDPRWRFTAMWVRQSIETLLAAPREDVTLDQLVFYACELLTGARVGEVCGLQVRDYDHAARPLPRLIFAEQADKRGPRGLKGGGAVREVPVHPALWKLLDEHVRTTLPLLLGRAPQPTDPLFPSRRGVVQSKRYMLKCLKRDLAKLGLEMKTNHDARRTLSSLLREDGADERIVAAITHEGRATSSRGVQRGYTIWSWEVLCREMMKFRIEARDHRGSVPPLAGHSTGHSLDAEISKYAESLAFVGGVDGTRSRSPNDGYERSSAVTASAIDGVMPKTPQITTLANHAVTPAVTGPVSLPADLRAAADALRSGRAGALTPDWRERYGAACEAAAGLLDESVRRAREVG